MAEALSLVASIIAVASLGASVAKGLNGLVEDLHSAGDEIKAYATDVNGLVKLLGQVRATVETLSGPQLADQELINDVLDACNRALPPLNAVQTRLNRYRLKIQQSRNRSKIRHYGLAVRWVFRSKQKLLFFRGTIQGQHQLLNTILQLMILRSHLRPSVTADTRRPHEEALREAIEALTLKLQTNSQAPTTLPQQRASRTYRDQTLTQLTAGLSISDDSTQTYESSNATLTMSRPEAAPGEGLTEDEITALEQGIDYDLGPDTDAVEILEDMRALARRVVRRGDQVFEATTQSYSRSSSTSQQQPVQQSRPHSNNVGTENVVPTLRREPVASPPPAQPVLAGELTLKTSDMVDFLIPKNMIRTFQELCRFVATSSVIPRQSDASSGEFQLMSSKGAIILPLVYESVIAKDDFVCAYMIFTSNHTKQVMNQLGLGERYLYLTNDAFRDNKDREFSMIYIERE